MTNAEAAKKALIAHYVELCAVSEDWKRQAWISANDLAGQFPAEFSDLPEMLTEAMKGRKEPCCTTPTSSSGTDGESGVPASNAVHGQKPC